MANKFERSERNNELPSASAVADEFSEAAVRVQESAQRQVDRLSASIRSNPIQSAAIAAGLGFLFALIARR